MISETKNNKKKIGINKRENNTLSSKDDLKLYNNVFLKLGNELWLECEMEEDSGILEQLEKKKLHQYILK